VANPIYFNEEDNLMLCQLCEQGYLTNKTEKELIHHKGFSEEVDWETSKCDFCLAEIVSPEQTIKNKETVKKFKERIDNEYA
jgi:hypothetical protein